jgi:hypothetical protein
VRGRGSSASSRYPSVLARACRRSCGREREGEEEGRRKKEEGRKSETSNRPLFGEWTTSTLLPEKARDSQARPTTEHPLIVIALCPIHSPVSFSLIFFLFITTPSEHQLLSSVTAGSTERWPPPSLRPWVVRSLRSSGPSLGLILGPSLWKLALPTPTRTPSRKDRPRRTSSLRTATLGFSSQLLLRLRLLQVSLHSHVAPFSSRSLTPHLPAPLQRASSSLHSQIRYRSYIPPQPESSGSSRQALILIPTLQTDPRRDGDTNSSTSSSRTSLDSRRPPPAGSP